MSINICRGPAMEAIRDDPHGDPRWCFACRKVNDFRFIVMASIEPSYYDPEPKVVCAECATTDGDLFPGRIREWEC
ncbi:MAG: hypothetical protein ACTHV8_04165 [Nesterenkonia sp.]